ncbi:MAG TPA: CinA family protein [Casimicrobiaceae bacterium]|nr:CinA family protein [Casimicrobiaceae bacterium]
MEPDVEVLAADLGTRLLALRYFVTAAESCTGGLVAGAITAIAGSSDWFDRGFVTYSNESKRELLGVDEAILRDHGAVSEPTAIAMAQGALKRSDATLSVAITGIAGPGGGTPSKPVGMVCFAWAKQGSATVSTTHYLAGDRAEVRHASVAIALRGLIDFASSP